MTFDWTDVQASYNIYTDGSADVGVGHGAWAYVIINRDDLSLVYQDSGYVKETTNNRMEMKAVIEALKYKIPTNSVLHIYTDSEYVWKGASIWLHGWMARDWRTKYGKSVENKGMWQELHRLMQHRAILWHDVKGHSGNYYNDFCHNNANEARLSKGKGKVWKSIKSVLSRL